MRDPDDTVDLHGLLDSRDPAVDVRWPIPAVARPGEPGLPPDPFEPAQGISEPGAGQVAWYAARYRLALGAVVVAVVACVAFALGLLAGAGLYAWWLAGGGL